MSENKLSASVQYWLAEPLAPEVTQSIDRIASAPDVRQMAILPDVHLTLDHNHVRRETHFGREYWVHRKGARSARKDEPGIIPGSMGTASFHVVGRGCQESLTSCSHGAGRRLGRTDARRTITTRQLHREMGMVWFDHRRSHSLVEEAPGAYRSIHAVMHEQRDLVRILRELHPLLSYKGA